MIEARKTFDRLLTKLFPHRRDVTMKIEVVVRAHPIHQRFQDISSDSCPPPYQEFRPAPKIRSGGLHTLLLEEPSQRGPLIEISTEELVRIFNSADYTRKGEHHVPRKFGTSKRK